ncbi:TPA: hypothetical protein ACQJO1_004672 [Vibrio parahaemolyticus]
MEPVNPKIIVDNIRAGSVYVWLSPDNVPVHFQLSECFSGFSATPETSKAWANELRKIADQLDGQESK